MKVVKDFSGLKIIWWVNKVNLFKMCINNHGYLPVYLTIKLIEWLISHRDENIIGWLTVVLSASLKIFV